MEFTEQAHAWIEMAALGVELLATVLIIVAIFAATGMYLVTLFREGLDHPNEYNQYKQRLGRALLLCLEILVAADIVRTIALDSTLISVVALGLLVVVRTFLSWSLILEVEGRWPWKSEPDDAPKRPPTHPEDYP